MTDRWWKFLVFLLWADITVTVGYGLLSWAFDLPYVRFSIFTINIHT